MKGKAVLAFCVIIVLFVAWHEGVFNHLPFAGYPNYLIIVPDEFASDSTLTSYVVARGTQYTVEVKPTSEIYSQFHVTQSLFPPLFVRSVSNLQSLEYADVVAMWFDGVRYHMFGYTVGTTYRKVEDAPSPREVTLYVAVGNTWSGHVQVTYDGGSIRVAMEGPTGQLDWGSRYVGVDGNVYYKRTQADEVRDYILSEPNAEYVMLLGDVAHVPSFSLRIPQNNGIYMDMYQSCTDHPYSVRNSQAELPPDLAIGRVPVASLTELDDYLRRDLTSHFSLGKGLFLQANDEFGQLYHLFKDPIEQSFPTVAFTLLYDATQNTVYSAINSGTDFLLMGGHGLPYLAMVCRGGLGVSEVQNLHFSNPMVVYALCCSSADFSFLNGGEGLGQAFLTEANTNTLIYVGAVLPSGWETGLSKHFFENLARGENFGVAWRDSKAAYFNAVGVMLQNRLIWNLLGDPTLSLPNPYPVS